MADEHLGINIEPKVSLGSLNKLYETTNKILGNAHKLDGSFKDVKLNGQLSSGLNKANGETEKATESAKNLKSATEKVNGEGFKKLSNSAKEAGTSAGKLRDYLSRHFGKAVKTKMTVDSSEAERNARKEQEVLGKTPKRQKTVLETKDESSNTLDKVDRNLKKTQTDANEAHHSVLDIAKGVAIGQGIWNSVSNGLSNVYGALKSTVKEGIALNDATNRINAGFHHMGMSANDVKILDDQIQYLHKNVGLTGIQVADMQRDMLNYSKIGRAGAEEMTTSLAAIGASTRMPTDRIAKLGGQLMRVGASGKITASSLSRVLKTAPGLYAVLAKGAGMTQTQLKNTLATGKVTQVQFQRWLANGSKYASGIFKEYGHTVAGARARITAGWQDIEKQITKPLMSVRGSAAQQLATLVQSHPVQQGARLLGEGIRNIAIWGMRGLRFLSQHRKDVVGVGSDLVKIAGIMAKDVWEDFSHITFDIAQDFGLVNKKAKPGSGLHSFRLAMDGLARNRGAIKAITNSLIVIAGLKGLVTIAGAIKELSSGFGKDTLLGKGVKNYLARGAAEKEAMNKGTISSGAGMVTGIGIASIGLGAGTQAVQAIKDRHNAEKRSRDIGGSIGAALGGGIAMAINPALAPVGVLIGKAFGRFGGHAVNQFTRGFQRSKPPKNKFSFENFGWNTHKWINEAGRAGGKIAKALGRGGKSWNRNAKDANRYFNGVTKHTTGTAKSIRSWVSKTGRNMQSGWNRDTKNFNSSLARGRRSWNRGSKSFGKSWNAFWKQTDRWAVASWHGTERNWNNFWKYLPRNWHNFQKSFGRGWRNFWHGIALNFQNVWKGIKSVWDHSIGAIVKGMHNTERFFGRLRGIHIRGISGNTISKAIHAHANGTTSLVGEAGPELAYRPWANRARILGANGPEITKVKPNEKILNARDTRKVMAGGLGRGVVLKGYAGGTEKLGQTKRTVTSDYRSIQQNASKSLKRLNRDSRSNWNSIKNHSTKSVNQIRSHNNSVWRSIASQTSRQTTRTRRKTVSDFQSMQKGVDRQTNRTRRSSIADYTNMRKGIGKQMTAIHSGVITSAKSTAKGYGKAVNKLVDYSRTAMKGTTKQLNRGISGIDKTLSQFGGNNSVIKPIHFAEGSGGHIPHNTIAMVNDDANHGQEGIVRNNNLILPHGEDRIFALAKGDQVLNHRQLNEFADRAGLPHFAKGSGVNKNALRRLADRSSANPARSFARMFLDNIRAEKPKVEEGTTTLGKNSGHHFGVPWNSAMWSVIEDAIGSGAGKGGTREEFLHYAESVFSGVPYQMGAASRRLSDCSGMVMQALRHFGIDIGRTTVAMQHSAGVEYLGKSLRRTLPGDLVIFGHGTGAAGHVGIIKNPRRGTMFNETPPRARVSYIDDDTDMGYGFYRVRGLHNAKPKKGITPSKRLKELARRELGAKAIKWIKDNLGDDISSFKLGGDVSARARTLYRALKRLDPNATRNGIIAILGNWVFESGGLNPSAVNSSGGASGLGQWLGNRLTNLRAYARRHGTSWKNPATQLGFAMHGDTGNTGIFRSVLEGHGSVESLATRFSNDWERGGYTSNHVAGAESIRHALGYASGGNPSVNTPFVVGEEGPEVLSFDKPAHVYSRNQSKKLNFETPKARVNTPEPIKRTPNMPTININISGPISSPTTAEKYGDIISKKINQVLEHMADTWGYDTSLQ